MSIDPDCHYGDHHWVGGSCSRCGKPFRCICGQFAAIETIEAHLERCPVVLAALRESEDQAA